MVQSNDKPKAPSKSGSVTSCNSKSPNQQGQMTLSSSEEVSGLPSSSRKRSWVWIHFDEYMKKEMKVVDGKEIEVFTKRVHCTHCPEGVGDYACVGNGTSGMMRHLNLLCKNYLPNQDTKRKKLGGDNAMSNKIMQTGFVQTDCMKACIEMIVIDELPFSFVEKTGFRRFCSVSCPLFKVPSRRTLVTQFLELYDCMKINLRNDLGNHRVSLTTDTWTSLQNISYMVLTAHFIDDEWNMHKRVLNFCMIANHQGNTIGKLIESCLIQWKIEKVLTITMDNASANGVAIDWIRNKMNGWENSQSVLGGKYLHVRCCAHICNIIVKSGLKILDKSVMAIRNAVKYVRSSPQRLEYCKSSVQKEKISCKGLVIMDVPTRWNSTFFMLEAALKFKKAFARMQEDESSPFLAYFNEPDEEFDEDGNIMQNKGKKGKVGPPVNDDWEKAELFVNFLRVFYDVTLRVSASSRPTVHTSFHDVLFIEHKIDSLFVPPEITIDPEMKKILAYMGASMRRKYNKYFGSFKELNLFILIGVALDPRFKLRHITYRYKKEGLDDEQVTQMTREIKGFFMSLYEVYVPKVDGVNDKMKEVSQSYSQGCSSSRGNTIYNERDEMLDDWRSVVEESDEAVVAHEVDKYLLDPLELTTKNGQPFDLLLWWKLNGPKYPVLASIAKDVLAIQVSTVASESAFSTGRRVIDSFRSSLTPKSVEALICMQNWLRGDDIQYLEYEPGIEEYEFYEDVEAEYANNGSSEKETIEDLIVTDQM